MQAEHRSYNSSEYADKLKSAAEDLRARLPVSCERQSLALRLEKYAQAILNPSARQIVDLERLLNARLRGA
jgi:hypothetical protein